MGAGEVSSGVEFLQQFPTLSVALHPPSRPRLVSAPSDLASPAPPLVGVFLGTIGNRILGPGSASGRTWPSRPSPTAGERVPSYTDRQGQQRGLYFFVGSPRTDPGMGCSLEVSRLA